jgi:hypothetical protein
VKEYSIMTDSSAVAVRSMGAGEFSVSPQTALDQIHEVQAVFKDVMKSGEHYGVIPGSSKPTLLKPGAELLANMYQYAADEIDIVNQVEQWDVPVTATTFPLFRYMIRVTLHDKNGRIMARGLGECNSFEAKYRWRSSEKVCPACGKATIIKGKAEYGGGWLCYAKKGGCGLKLKDDDPYIKSQAVGKVANDGIFDLVNTLLKMAKKRAFIDAVLSATRTSGIFTQDIEDFATLASVATEVVDTTTGEITQGKKPEEAKKEEAKPGIDPAFVIPFGLYKGQDVHGLKANQLAGLVASMQKSGKEKELPEFYKLASGLLTGDAFGGVFEKPPTEEVRAEVVADDPEEAMKLRVEVREIFEQIIPAFSAEKPKLTKEQKEIASRIVQDAFNVKGWAELQKLPAQALRDGMAKFVGLVKAESIKQKEGAAQ